MPRPGGFADPRFEDVLAAVRGGLSEHGRVVLLQIVRAEGSTPGKVGWKMLVLPDGSVFGNLGGGACEALAIADARSELGRGPSGEGGYVKRYYLTEEASPQRGEATGMVCGGFVEVFGEVLRSAPLLLVCGGGPVGRAVAAAGALAGFDVAVLDDRPEFLGAASFPERASLVRVGRDYREPFLAAWPGRELYAAVVTRCWETDTAALAGIAAQAPPGLRYLGLLGSRRKIERVRTELATRGVDLDGLGVPLHAPIGLAIGGDSPGEIALAILAEIVAVRHGAALAGDLTHAIRAPRSAG
jgi:xanthine dehydrogenase accessory factor